MLAKVVHRITTTALAILCISALLKAEVYGAQNASVPAPSAVQLHITVPATTCTASDVYLGVVARDRPWRRPTAERVVQNGSASFTVPAGTYDVIAAARGCSVDSRRISVGSERDVDVQLPLAAAPSSSGTVRDESGKPIAGARIGTVRASIQPAVGMFSELALQTIALQETAFSDELGRWTLGASADEKMPLIVQAAGYAPVIHAVVAGDAPSSITTILRAGSRLRVKITRPDHEAVLVLAPMKPIASPMPLHWQEGIWSRAVTASEISWDSLPAGEYRVLAKWPDPVRFGPTVEVARVSLRAGEHLTVSAKLPATPPRAARHTALFAATPIDPTSLRVYANDAGQVTERRWSIELVAGGNVVYVEGAASPADVYLTTPDHLILGAPREVDSTQAGPTIRLSRGEGLIRVVADRELPSPRAVRVEFNACVADHRPAVVVPVGLDGALAVPWPSTCRVAVFRFEDFAAQAITADIPPGKTRVLGQLRLGKPARAEIQVLRDVDQQPVRGALVLASVVRESGDVVTIAEGVAGDDGRLTLHSLPAEDEITIEARDPATSLSGTRRLRFDPVLSGAIEVITIPAPASLTIVPSFDPAFASEYPTAAIRNVSLRRIGGDQKDRLLRNITDENREARFDALVPGQWQAIVLFELEQTTAMIDVEPILLDSGDDERIRPVLRPAVFQGTVMSRGRGLETQLMIRDTLAKNPIGRTVRTNRNGEFKAVLPSPGFYDVMVMRLLNGAIESKDLGEHAFLDPGRPVKLELSIGAIDVKVEDDSGAPAEARLTALLQKNRASGGVQQISRFGRTDGRGRATFDDIQDGDWIVEARDEAGHVAETTVRVTDGVTATAELSLARKPKIEGYVREENGSVAVDAAVHCFSVGQDLLPRQHSTKTDAGGYFSLPVVRPDAAVFRCGAITAAGASVPFVVSSTAPVNVTISAATGILVIDDWTDVPVRNSLWLTATDGRLLNLSWVDQTFGSRGGPLTIPRLPAGFWKIVRADTLETWLMLGRGLGTSLKVESEFRLDAGESRHLRVNDASASSSVDVTR